LVHGAGRGGFSDEGDRGAQVHEQLQQHDRGRGEHHRQPGRERDQHRGDQGRFGAQVEGDRAAQLGADIAALGHRGGHGGVGVVGEDQVGGLAGQVRAAPSHRDTDVGGG